MNTVIAAFLFGFPALFSIVNPVSGAFIFRIRTIERSHVGRVRLARHVGVYAALVMLVALWAGSYVLAFFGISLPALRCAGGVVLAMYAWSSLNAPERREARKGEQADAAAGQDDPAFYPLTLPFTTGPGTISVAVALGSAHPAESVALVPFFVGMSAAAMSVAVLIWLFYRGCCTITVRNVFSQDIGLLPLIRYYRLCNTPPEKHSATGSTAPTTRSRAADTPSARARARGS